MEPRAPRQLTSIKPFDPRNFFTISKDFVSLYPELDIRSGDSSIIDSLGRPLLGENPPAAADFENDSVPIETFNSYGSSWIIRDENFEDTGLQVSKTGDTELTVSSGYAVIVGIYTHYTEDCVIDATDGTNYSLGDATAGDYFLCITPCDASTGEFDLILERHNSTSIALFEKTDLQMIISIFPFIVSSLLKLALIEIGEGGQIIDISFEDSDLGWDRELLAYPPGPPLNPSLNGGVVESGDTWVDDWT